jgi:hypothetical protein
MEQLVGAERYRQMMSNNSRSQRIFAAAAPARMIFRSIEVRQGRRRMRDDPRYWNVEWLLIESEGSACAQQWGSVEYPVHQD